jgi:type VI protein secretion system component VasK
MDEVEERLAAVYAARYQHELDATTADLPAATSKASGWRTVLTLLWTQIMTELATLLGRTPGTTKRRRVLTAVAAMAIILLAGGLVALIVSGFADGGEPHEFGPAAFEH